MRNTRHSSLVTRHLSRVANKTRQTRRKTMRGLLKKWWVWLGLILIVAVAIFIGMRAAAAGTGRAPLQTAQVSRGDIQSTVLSSAALQPAADLTLTFGSGGTLTDLKMKP